MNSFKISRRNSTAADNIINIQTITAMELATLQHAKNTYLRLIRGWPGPRYDQLRFGSCLLSPRILCIHEYYIHIFRKQILINNESLFIKIIQYWQKLMEAHKNICALFHSLWIKLYNYELDQTRIS